MKIYFLNLHTSLVTSADLLNITFEDSEDDNVRHDEDGRDDGGSDRDQVLAVALGVVRYRRLDNSGFICGDQIFVILRYVYNLISNSPCYICVSCDEIRDSITI